MCRTTYIAIKRVTSLELQVLTKFFILKLRAAIYKLTLELQFSENLWSQTLKVQVAKVICELNFKIALKPLGITKN